MIDSRQVLSIPQIVDAPAADGAPHQYDLKVQRWKPRSMILFEADGQSDEDPAEASATNRFIPRDSQAGGRCDNSGSSNPSAEETDYDDR